MTICPIAIAVTCKKCPLFKICPAKSILGDYKKDADTEKSDSSSKGDSEQKQ